MIVRAAFVLLFATFISANPISKTEEISRNNARLPIMYDPYWPKDCKVPDCEEAQRAVNYPAPLAGKYYQCAFDGARWIPQIVSCPCDLVFSYEDQKCVYPWSIQLWCEYEYIVDVVPVHCYD